MGQVGNQSVQMGAGETSQWKRVAVGPNKVGPTGQYGGADTSLSLKKSASQSLGKKQEESGLFAAERL